MDKKTITENGLLVAGLYYRYKKVSDNDIKEYLSKVKIVKKEHKGVNSVFRYYPLNDEEISKISEKPRNLSLTFDATNTTDTPILGLKVYKEITYLVKSTSRFFLKPDIGEVFDQIDFHDRYRLGNKIKAICIEDGYHTLEGTDGEHFLMTATLLINENEELISYN